MKDEIKSITFLENDLLAIGNCNNNKIEIWNVTNQSIILNLNDHNDCVNGLLSVRLLNQSFLISGSDDATIRLYDDNFKTLQILNIQDSVLTLNYNTNSMILIAGQMKDNSIKIWALTHKQLIEKELAHYGYITTICVLENGLIATGSDDTTIKIRKIKNESSLELVTTLTEHKREVRVLILLKNNSLVSGSWDKTIKVWNQKTDNTFECVATLNQSSEVLSLAISGSSSLFSGHYDGTIQIRNQTTFVLLQILKEYSYDVYSIILLNNENLASGSFREIKIWQKINETSFILSKTLKGHTDWVNSLIVLPNNMFASASDDNSIRIWDQTTFECIYILKDHTRSVNSLAVARNEYLISISYDKSIIVWDILNNFSILSATKTAAPLYSLERLRYSPPRKF
jgi:WD40 repeat protein